MDHERVACRCSFCNKQQTPRHRLIAGQDGVFICDECVALCSEIIVAERQADEKTRASPRAWWQFWQR
jgi:ATP-dependent Clp protease ATP-binding subunit ClpX